MQIIKDRKIVEDQCIHLADEPLPQSGCITVSVARWNSEKEILRNWNGDLGIRLTPQDSIEDIGVDLPNFQLAAIEFPSFADGRCFSVARLLRSRYHFEGEIRAIGDFILDQVFYLARVGVNAFELNGSADPEAALKALNEFSVKYQISTDNE